jgi:hypothetical protein
VVTQIVPDHTPRWRNIYHYPPRPDSFGGFLLENTAADISSNGKDNLSKKPLVCPFTAWIVSKERFLPVYASNAGFRAVDFQQ